MDDLTKQFLDTINEKSFSSEIENLSANIPDVVIEDREFDILQIPTFTNPMDNDVAYDYVLTRSVLYTLLDKVGKSLEFAIQLARIDQSPKTLQSIKELTDEMRNISNDIMKLSEKYEKIKSSTKKQPDDVEISSGKTPSIRGTSLELKRVLQIRKLEAVK